MEEITVKKVITKRGTPLATAKAKDVKVPISSISTGVKRETVVGVVRASTMRVALV